MEGISLHFDDPAIPVLGQKAAPGRALPAGAGIPGSLAEYQVRVEKYKG
jgi:hypothetical protein